MIEFKGIFPIFGCEYISFYGTWNKPKSFKNKDASCLSLRKELIVKSAKFPQ